MIILLIRLLISIHAPRVGGDGNITTATQVISISIHAPRVGGDPDKNVQENNTSIISIHAPRVGGDRQRAVCTP